MKHICPNTIAFHSSSFYQVSSSTLAKRAWICCCCTVSSWGAISAFISYFEELFFYWERWLEWLGSPQTAPNYWCKKSAVEILVIADGRSCDWGHHCFTKTCKNKRGGKSNTPVWCQPNRLRCLSQWGRKILERKWVESDLVEYLCVPLTSITFFFIVVCLING